MIGEEGDDFFGERVEAFGARVLVGDFFGERVLLLHEGAEEEHEPGFPVGCVSGERGLGAAKGAVVAFLGGLDDALQRAVGNMDVPGTQEHERGEHAGEAAIAVLKRMDGKEDDDEAADEQQRMQGAFAFGLGEPGNEGLHLARRVEWRDGLKDDADLLSIRIEGGDVVWQRLVVAAVALVLGAVAQEVLMELADHVLRDGNLLEGIEHLIHDIGVSGNLLLIARLELGDVQAAEQILDLAVGELGALDAGGGADTLNGGDLAQPVQFFGRETADHAPLAFEFVQLGDEPESFGRDGENRGQHGCFG